MKSTSLFIIIIITLFGCQSKSSKIVKTKDQNDVKDKSKQNEESKGEKIVSDSFYLVTKIKDGDTFSVLYPDSSGDEAIRPIGINTPEIHNTLQCYGKEATDYLSNLILGKKIRLVLDKGRYDRYHRTLAYVYLEDSTFVNAELVRNGFADTMNFAPNLKYKDLFLKFRNEAKENKRGMWKECF